jgi:hypothetical protein
MNNMQIQRSVLFLLSSLCSFSLMAFPCYLTLIKQTCWKDYALTVTMRDADKSMPITDIKIPTGELWTRVPFDCKPQESLSFVAQFTPVIWQGDENKTYLAKRNWFLPQTVQPDILAWNIDICFPGDFTAVPAPNGSANCPCDKSIVTAIKPK